MRPRTPQRGPNWLKNAQDRPTSAPRPPQEHLRTSRMPQDWTKSNPKAPKLVPRPPSECPKNAQKRPNSAPRAPKRTQERRKNDPKAPHVEAYVSTSLLAPILSRFLRLVSFLFKLLLWKIIKKTIVFRGFFGCL